MMSIDSRNRARAVDGFTALAQYSMPVPSGNATRSRPPDITSSMAYSSARRFGYSKFGGVPNTLIRPFVWGMSAAAVMFGAGFMQYWVLWCSFSTSPSYPSLSASSISERYRL